MGIYFDKLPMTVLDSPAELVLDSSAESIEVQFVSITLQQTTRTDGGNAYCDVETLRHIEWRALERVVSRCSSK